MSTGTEAHATITSDSGWCLSGSVLLAQTLFWCVSDLKQRRDTGSWIQQPDPHTHNQNFRIHVVIHLVYNTHCCSHAQTHTHTFSHSLKHIPNTRYWSTPVVLLAGWLLITYKHTHHLTAQTITHTHTLFTVKEKPVNIHTGCWLIIPNLVRGCCLWLDSKNL